MQCNHFYKVGAALCMLVAMLASGCGASGAGGTEGVEVDDLEAPLRIEVGEAGAAAGVGYWEVAEGLSRARNLRDEVMAEFRITASGDRVEVVFPETGSVSLLEAGNPGTMSPEMLEVYRAMVSDFQHFVMEVDSYDFDAYGDLESYDFSAGQGLDGTGQGPDVDKQSCSQCLNACAQGTLAIQAFCRIIWHPAARAACWAVQFAGPTACSGMCYWWFC